MASHTYRVPLSSHPVDTSSGRTLGPGETIDAADLVLDGDNTVAIAHDQRLVDEVLIDLQDAPAAPEPSKDDLMKRAGELDIAGRSSMDKDELKAAIAEAEAEAKDPGGTS